ncbi:hypothetical protein INT47_007346 [Mucor saturninus]|uniref:Uncharacterized protein n=1 Tax=Mucor saturninus TaxID=64648 RepID=A0A8H7V070_9FUNG|nr:hypothetical protein INT47_007346 [Mucor saturninus]
MRPRIYPDTEEFIDAKITAKLAKMGDETSTSTMNQPVGGNRGLKRKETFEAEKEKSVAKRNRSTASSSSSTLICKSCDTSGHSSARSKLCPNHNYTLQKLIEKDIGAKYQRYTISLPLKGFLNETDDDDDRLQKAVNKIQDLSSFLRLVLFKAQIFVNDYILQYPNNLSNEFFQQNFWYSLCRVVCKQLSIKDFQLKYATIHYLEDAWMELNNLEGVNLNVEKDGLKNYGQVLATACETTGTCYNNYYIENFQNIICNYFNYMICKEFPDLKKSVIRKLVYEHVLNQVLSSDPVAVLNYDILPPLIQETKNGLQAFINPLIVELKNRLPSFTITKATQNTAPFGILPALRHILSKYESIIAENSTLQKRDSEPGKSQDTVQSGEKKKKDDNAKHFVLPKIFSLFPNPGLRWRFIKIDSQNVTGVFPGSKLKKEKDETLFSFTQRYFYDCFNFAKLKIRSLKDLKELPATHGKMFLNGMYTDELDDFNTEELKTYFRPCTVDPGRKDVFVSYHGDNDVRRLSSKEYCNMGGVTQRHKQEQELKKSLGIDQIETNIPSPKTTSHDAYILYITYILQHIDTLFNFYGFRTTNSRWCNYIASQKSIEDAVNILINGSTKYNKKRRKNKKKSKKRRRSRIVDSLKSKPKIIKREHKEKFEGGDRNKMPLIIFGDGLKNKSQTKFKGLRSGVMDKLYRQLKRREKLGELLLVNINEFKTSKVSILMYINTFDNDLKNMRCGTDEKSSHIHQILICKRCNIFWNRDVMAAKNMLAISQSIWDGQGRPTVFKRLNATSNVVTSSHSSEEKV